jgi:molybdopterin molybdotransferase
MISVDQALTHVLEHAAPLPAVRVPVAESLGLALAEDVTSDVDSPPFDKSIVDGYAVVAADLIEGNARLQIVEEVTAGALPTRPIVRDQATRIMTGAPIPAGCDAVVMVEQTRVVPSAKNDGSQYVEVSGARLKPGQNILRRGAAMRAGDVVLSVGHVIRPAEVGLLCEVGRADVLAVRRPTVAVLPTGNEIIPHTAMPRGGQIRNTNGPMLAAAVERAGGEPRDLGVARDEPGELRWLVGRGLEADVLLLSGGVSAGILDLVPQALAELGVRQVFHKVQFKPGKPLWFGVFESGGRNRLVFGLPGNPVSSLVCFEMFVRPAIGRLAGRAHADMRRGQGVLTSEFAHRGDRPTYHPARLTEGEGRTAIQPLAWQGSADLRGLAEANGLVHFPPGERLHQPGDELPVFWL